MIASLGEISVSRDMSVLDALERLDMYDLPLLIVFENDDLAGYVEDLSVRKCLVSGDCFEHTIEDLIDSDFQVFSDDEQDEIAKALENADDDYKYIFVFSKDKVEIHRLNGYSKYWSDDIPVVIMAGGLGTRLNPFTKIIPKPLMPIGEKSIVEHIIDRFKTYDLRHFYLSVNYKANIIKAYFQDQQHDYKISFVQESKPLGTAGSLRFLKGYVKKPFFVSNCDILIHTNFQRFYDFHMRNGFALSMAVAVQFSQIPYGVCIPNSDFSLKMLVEKPVVYNLVNTGFYILNPEVLDLIPEGKIYHITDLVEDITGSGMKVGVYPISDRAWIDFGQTEEFKKNMNLLLSDETNV